MTSQTGFISNHQWPENCLEIKVQDPVSVNNRHKQSLQNIEGNTSLSAEQIAAHKAALTAILGMK